MIEVSVPGFGELRLTCLVLDFNGTLAVGGMLLPGVAPLLGALAHTVDVHVLTADTFGSTRRELSGVPCAVTVLEPDGQDAAKADFVKRLGSRNTAAIGNGRNDRLMLREAALGIAVIQGEGAAFDTLRAALVVSTDIRDALGLLLNPNRIIATLRC